jgi:hypothetical protein
LGPPIGSATPSTRTVSGPRIRNSRRLFGICVREKCPPCGGSTQSRRTVLGQVWDIAPRRSAHAPNARNSSKATNTLGFSPRGDASRRRADPESVRRSWSESRVLSATRDSATGPRATDQSALGRLRRHAKSGRSHGRASNLGQPTRKENDRDGKADRRHRLHRAAAPCPRRSRQAEARPRSAPAAAPAASGRSKRARERTRATPSGSDGHVRGRDHDYEELSLVSRSAQRSSRAAAR